MSESYLQESVLVGKGVLAVSQVLALHARVVGATEIPHDFHRPLCWARVFPLLMAASCAQRQDASF